MAINIQNTNYAGEVLEHILTLATLGNEFVEKGLIHVIPGINKSVSVPRMKTGRMLQRRIESPVSANSKGDTTYSEKKLTPRDIMVYTEFNPRDLESIWRSFQPKGNLVFRELPPNIQSLMLSAIVAQVQQELGEQYVTGEYVENGTDLQLMDGVITQAAKDENVIIVSSTATTMIDRLKDVRSKIPKAIRNNPKLTYLMSISDFDTYGDELTAREYKNADETEVNKKRYRGTKIETVAAWPDGLIIATLCSQDRDGNFFAAVNLSDDEDVIQVEKVSAASEKYFFKMLMKADTNIGFGEELVVLDWRDVPQFVVDPQG